METKRRDFIKGAAWMGAVAMAAGCTTAGGAAKVGGVGSMSGFAVKPLKKVRVGVVGLGNRGPGAVHRIASIPGTEVTALCDLYQDKVSAQQAWLKRNNKPAAREFVGAEGWKAMCDWDGIDVVYCVTNWQTHVPIMLRAMNSGKHVMCEVPAALTLDDCWAVVETAEKTKLHCMQLENCCYGESEMLALNLCRLGKLGELVHGEGAYIHDLRGMCYAEWDKGGYYDYWRLRYNKDHPGNQYETHGLGPICQYMNINRGDRFDYLVSVDSQQLGFHDYAAHHFPEGSWQRQWNIKMADMNTTIIKTAIGRTIMVQHDVANARPYDRINLISGTRGILQDYPYRCAIEPKPGAGAHVYDGNEASKILEEYRHPLWKKAGDIAKKVGGHGGMDFLMDLRWSYCLQNGLPLDMDVYDLASWCALGELTEKSATNRGRSMDVPDFTRGGWKTAKPLGIVDVDLAKLGLSASSVDKDSSALSV